MSDMLGKYKSGAFSSTSGKQKSVVDKLLLSLYDVDGSACYIYE